MEDGGGEGVKKGGCGWRGGKEWRMGVERG